MSHSIETIAREEFSRAAPVEGSYNISSFAADIDGEIQRLNAQVDLFWNQELPLYQRLGLQDGMSLLDCGCGSGYLLKKLQAVYPGLRCTGVEIDGPLVAAATSLMAGNGCQIFQRPITALGLPDESFDFVISRLVLEHLPEPLVALREIFRVLKVGARAIFLDNDFDLHERTWPDSPALGELYDAYRRARRAEGGNPCIGRQLPLLLKKAGFTGVELHLVAAHNQLLSDKAFLKAEGAGIAAQLVKTGYLEPSALDDVTGQWHSMLMDPDHSIFRMLFAAVGAKAETPTGVSIAEARSVSTGNGAASLGEVERDAGKLRSREQIQLFMQQILAEEMKVPADSIPTDESLIRVGVDSMAALTLCSALEARLGTTLTVAELLCGSSIDDLAEKIALTKTCNDTTR